MRYLADTNIWILYLKQRNSAVEGRLRSTPAADIAVCSVVRAELLHGARKYGNVANRVALVEETLAPYWSLSFDDPAAGHYAVVRHHLESIGAVIGANDLLIASIALAHGLIIATGNVREFQRIPGLAVEDWTAMK
jgi:tRNA(fMet)-specific endonuclease VapC